MKLHKTVRRLMKNESGQDLIEYSLVAALIALAAVAGMQSLANGINSAFNTVGSMLTSAV